MFMRFLTLLVVLSAGLTAAAAEVLAPKVVVVAMFEQGKDTGDVPGEFQFWVERLKLDKVYALPSAYHDVRSNADGSVIGIVTGIGNTRAAATIMALGSDPRFDLSKSYWVVAGIAGIDPEDGSIGSAVWADYIVNGDLGHEIDPREIPADWPTGYVPLRKGRPYELPRSTEETSQVFQLDPGLVNWAYELTKDTPLADSAGLQARRAVYTGFPNAQRPPFVMKGATLSSETYWHGRLMNEWANAWVKYHTDGKGNFMTTAMEDTGTAQALTWLTRAGKADVHRLLVLRTASNYDMQWPGATAAESMFGEKIGHYSGYIPSLEAAFQVGNKVVQAILADWEKFKVEPPAAKQP
jgi:purine nucleoside permease